MSGDAFDRVLDCSPEEVEAAVQDAARFAIFAIFLTSAWWGWGPERRHAYLAIFPPGLVIGRPPMIRTSS